MAKDSQAARCEWIRQHDALVRFAVAEEGTQGAQHIKPLHWHVACRLVLEGGFHPADIVPRPPFKVSTRKGRHFLEYDPEHAGGGERTILGGLKTKDVDVVVAKDGIGPCLAVSMKGTLNAFRNLTNRMEEAVGDCTNLHLSYPALVYGFLHVLRAGVEGSVSAPDVAVLKSGKPADSIERYHDVMARLAGRDDVRADATKYEAVALALVRADKGHVGEFHPGFPREDSPLRLGDFFPQLYRQYDMRFVYSAPALASVTRRLEWDEESPALNDVRMKSSSSVILTKPEFKLDKRAT